MKIIATVNESNYGSTFLVEATSEELCLVIRGANDPKPREFGVGYNLRVGEHWRRVREINDAQERLESAASSLRAVAELLGTIDVVVPSDESSTIQKA